MNQDQELTIQLDALFNSKSVAIVGLPRGMKAGKLFLIALQDQGYLGKIYPVHPEAEEIDGLKAYPSVAAIPGPVELAIILVPHQGALPIVRECAAKGVKGAVLFTAGYKETGTVEGKAVEEELTRIARASGLRLLGPNCMGLYSPKTGLSFFPQLSRESGPVGLISHSGSLANILGLIASRKGLRFSKVVSLGNECDLTSADFLTYLGNDPETGVIGMYLEGIKDGPYFLKALKTATKKKPVILWKVGLTPEGSRAASSHTGALAGSRVIWEAVVRQEGAVTVTGFEALVDSLMGFSLLPEALGDQMAILSGPGGLAVAPAEACGNLGLRLAELSVETRSALAEFVPPTGTSLRNPVDVGLTASLEIDIYGRAARALAADPGVDAVVVVGRGMTPELNRQYKESLIQAQRDYQKPFVVVSIPGSDPDFGLDFFQAGIPFFESPERALTVYAAVRRNQRWRQRRAAYVPGDGPGEMDLQRG
jgi:acyl-CoA synthetase (NDP forming)